MSVSPFQQVPTRTYCEIFCVCQISQRFSSFSAGVSTSLYGCPMFSYVLQRFPNFSMVLPTGFHGCHVFPHFSNVFPFLAAEAAAEKNFAGGGRRRDCGGGPAPREAAKLSFPCLPLLLWGPLKTRFWEVAGSMDHSVGD